MTTRERKLLYIVGGVGGTLAISFAAYYFVLSPLVEKNAQIRTRQKEVAALEIEVDEILALKKKYEAARQQSLPGDPGVARQEYSNLLEAFCRKAEYAPGSYKILVSEPDNKSVPMLGPKKPAYTKLTYEMSVKGELYHLVEFLQSFYSQPLLHTIKKINIQRPSDNRSQGRKELDVTMTIEALVLDNAPNRPTLLPISREIALVASLPAFVGFNAKAAAGGKGTPLIPAGVLAEESREYLRIAGKDVFFGPRPPPPTARPDFVKAEDDISPFMVLTSIVGHNDGEITAVFRDQLNNQDHVITQNAKGDIKAIAEWETKSGKKFPVSGYNSREKAGNELIYGTKDGGNQRIWRVRRVTLDGVILERADTPAPPPADDGGEDDLPPPTSKPKPPPLAAIAGGAGAFVAVPEAKVYKVKVGQALEKRAGLAAAAPGFGKGGFPGAPPADSTNAGLEGPTLYLLTREAWRDIFAPIVLPTAEVVDDKGR